jgi:hypothetical protein
LACKVSWFVDTDGIDVTSVSASAALINVYTHSWLLILIISIQILVTADKYTQTHFLLVFSSLLIFKTLQHVVTN